MKKIYLTFVTALISSALLAQFSQKGTFLVGGSTNLNFASTSNKVKFQGTTTDNGKESNFSINPQAGYFLIDNLAVGAGIDLGFGKYQSPSGNLYDQSYTSIAVSPFVRYYFNKLYAQGSVGFGTYKTKSEYNGDFKSNLSTMQFALGYVVLLSDQVSLEPQLGYASNKNKGENNVEFKDSGLFASVGIFVYLSK